MQVLGAFLLAACLGLGLSQALLPCFEPTAMTSEPCADDAVCVSAGAPRTVQGSVQWREVRLYGSGSEVTRLKLLRSSVLGISGRGCQDQFFCSNGNNPCLNNGTCHSRGHRVVCICPPAYTGERCEQSNRCSTPTVVVRGLVTASTRPVTGGGCAPVRQCQASEVVVREATLSTDRVCEPHPDGCGRGARVAPPSSNISASIFDIACLSCPSGKVQNSSHFLGTSCSDPVLCPAATYASTQPNATDHASCVPCEHGSFSSAPSLNRSCTKWTSSLADWQETCENLGKLVINATNTSDYKCSFCNKTEYFVIRPSEADYLQCRPRTPCSEIGFGRMEVPIPPLLEDGDCVRCSDHLFRGTVKNGFCVVGAEPSESVSEKAVAIISGTVSGFVGLLATIISAVCYVTKRVQQPRNGKPKHPASGGDGDLIPNPLYHLNTSLGPASVGTTPKQAWTSAAAAGDDNLDDDHNSNVPDGGYLQLSVTSAS